MPKAKPQPGDIVLIPHPPPFRGHILARVVKVGGSLWVIENRFTDGLDGWDHPIRRKVVDWLPVAPGSDLDQLAIDLMKADRWASRESRKIDDAYHSCIRRMADGLRWEPGDEAC